MADFDALPVFRSTTSICTVKEDKDGKIKRHATHSAVWCVGGEHHAMWAIFKIIRPRGGDGQLIYRFERLLERREQILQFYPGQILVRTMWQCRAEKELTMTAEERRDYLKEEFTGK